VVDSRNVFSFFCLQTYMKEMEIALAVGESNNPTKATVDSVLPGVHQQFCNVLNEMKTIREHMKEGFTSLASANGKCAFF
jgi:hypothetical protein